MTNIPTAVYSPRLNEIGLSFYLDRIGKIGFINSVHGVYRLNSASVWTGASQASRLQQAIDVRESALRLARPIYRGVIREKLEEKKRQLAALMAEKSDKAA